MEPIRVVALHGFLGVPSDWREVEGPVKRKFPTVQWFSLNLNQLLKKSGAKNFDDFSAVIINELKTSIPQVDLLCGYSLGGRLAMHLLDEEPQYIRDVLMLSSSPGIEDQTEKASRVESDDTWAKRFIQEPFAKVVADWNALPIFKHSKEPIRNGEDYDMQILGKILSDFSLGKQKNFTSYLKTHARNLTWAYGERDERYQKMAESYIHMGANNIVAIPDAGHRVIFDNPDAVAELIGKILRQK